MTPTGCPKVLMAIDSLANGGAERQFALLAMELSSEWAVEVWSLADGPWGKVLSDRGIPVEIRSRSRRFDVRPAFDLWRRLHQIRPDVVYAQGWMMPSAAGPACASLRIPLVDSRMRGASVRRDNYHKTKLGLWWSDIVIANSQAGLRSLKLRSSEKGRVIYNGFDWGRVTPRTSEPLERRPYVAAMAARMQEMKDWDLYLDVAKLVTRRDPGLWRFLAIGGGPERERLINKYPELVSDGTLEFIPEVGDVMPLLATTDVGLLLTNPRRAAEGCSNSILEYMASGLPVICTDSGGNAELVREGVNGFVVPPSDAQSIVEKLAVLAQNPSGSRVMGTVGRERVRQEFSIESLAKGTVAAFRDAARRKKVDRPWVDNCLKEDHQSASG